MAETKADAEREAEVVGKTEEVVESAAVDFHEAAAADGDGGPSEADIEFHELLLDLVQNDQGAEIKAALKERVAQKAAECEGLKDFVLRAVRESKHGRIGQEEHKTADASGSYFRQRVHVGRSNNRRDPRALHERNIGLVAMSDQQALQMERTILASNVEDTAQGILRVAVRARRKQAVLALMEGYPVEVEGVKIVLRPACPHSATPKRDRTEGQDRKHDISGPDLLAEAIIHWGDAEVVSALISYEQGVTVFRPFSDVELTWHNSIPLQGKDEAGRTILHNVTLEAIEQAEAAAVLIRALSRADVVAEDKDGNQPLHYAAQQGHSYITESLLNQSADITATNARMETALHFAFRGGHKGVSTILIRNGASIAARDLLGRTPLQFAFMQASAAGQPLTRLKKMLALTMEIVAHFQELSKDPSDRSQHGDIGPHVFNKLIELIELLQLQRTHDEAARSSASKDGMGSERTKLLDYANKARKVFADIVEFLLQTVFGDIKLHATLTKAGGTDNQCEFVVWTLFIAAVDGDLDRILKLRETSFSAEERAALEDKLMEREFEEFLFTFPLSMQRATVRRVLHTLLNSLDGVARPFDEVDEGGKGSEVSDSAITSPIHGHTSGLFAELSDSSGDEQLVSDEELVVPEYEHDKSMGGLSAPIRRKIRLFHTLRQRLRLQEHAYHLLVDQALPLVATDELDDSDLTGRMVFPVEERLRWFNQQEPALDKILANPQSDGPRHPVFQDKRTQAAVQSTWDQKMRVKMYVRLCFWLVFVTIVMIITLAQTGRDSWYPWTFRRNLEIMFVEEPFDEVGINAFPDIATSGDYWDWLSNSFTPHLFEAKSFERPENASMQAIEHLHDIPTVASFNHFIGRPRIRFVRTQPQPCETVPEINFFEQANCYDLYKDGHPQEGTLLVGDLAIPFKSKDIPSYRGVNNVYTGQGHSVVIPNNETEWKAIMQQLIDFHAIDMNTRLAAVEFTVYNPSHNLFGVIQLVVEFDSGGGAIPTHKIDTLKLVQYVTVQDDLRLVLEIFAAIYFAVHAVREFIDMSATWRTPEGHAPCCGRWRAKETKEVVEEIAESKRDLSSELSASIADEDWEPPTFSIWYPSFWPDPDLERRLPPIISIIIPTPVCGRRKTGRDGKKSEGGCCQKRKPVAPKISSALEHSLSQGGGSSPEWWKENGIDVNFLQSLHQDALKQEARKSAMFGCFSLFYPRISVYLRPIVDFDNKQVRYIIPLYLYDSFNWVDMVLLGCYFAVTALHFVAVYWATVIPWLDQDNFHNTFRLAEIVQWKANMLGTMFAVACLKTLDFLRVSPALSTFILIIRGMIVKLRSFSVVFVVCLIAFAGFEYAVFGLKTSDASTISLSLMRHFSAALGEANFERTFWLDQWITPLSVTLFALFVVILLFNLLIAVMSEAYEEVSEQANALWSYTQFKMLSDEAIEREKLARVKERLALRNVNRQIVKGSKKVKHMLSRGLSTEDRGAAASQGSGSKK